MSIFNHNNYTKISRLNIGFGNAKYVSSPFCHAAHARSGRGGFVFIISAVIWAGGVTTDKKDLNKKKWENADTYELIFPHRFTPVVVVAARSCSRSQHFNQVMLSCYCR